MLCCCARGVFPGKPLWEASFGRGDAVFKMFKRILKQRKVWYNKYPRRPFSVVGKINKCYTGE